MYLKSMATKRPSSRLRNNSSKRVSKAAQQASTDPLADLHSYRRRLAARFNYDAARLGAYIDSLPTPPGSRIIEIPTRKTHPTRKWA